MSKILKRADVDPCNTWALENPYRFCIGAVWTVGL